MSAFDFKGYSDLLKNWIVFSQKHLYRLPENPDLMCYGAGEHGHWGTHTHQKAFSAFAIAATDEDICWDDTPITREEVLEQALSMLRYNLATHISGNQKCTDGKKWGHNWIYVLGIERMYHGIEVLDKYLTDKDRENIKTVILSECEFILNEYPVEAGLLAEKNKPESNIWNGAILFRATVLYPDLPEKDRYIDKARRFFLNGISIESDENSDEIIDGVRVGDYFVGANMFDSYACNHHLYMNVGYMAICLSNIAMLHFFLKGQGVSVGDIPYHNVYDLWKLVNTCTYSDGRLIRIGGDSRARYSYCQDYLLPVWALIEDVYGDDCSEMENEWLKILQKETSINGDGSFLSERFGYFEETSPVYYTRLETDRANSISMLLYWHKRFNIKHTSVKSPKMTEWYDDYHGSVLSADENRFTSFTWISSEKPQALILPKDDSSFAEWRYNLCGKIRGAGTTNEDDVYKKSIEQFDGGFLTSGVTFSHSLKFLAEGRTRENLAKKYVAFAALPDKKTILCLQYADAFNRVYVTALRGILWNVPNDIFNKCQRTLYYGNKKEYLRGGSLANKFETMELGNYANFDNKIGIASKTPLTLVRNEKRQVSIRHKQGVDSGSLYAEEICSPYLAKRRFFDRGENMIDTGFAMSLGDAEDTKKLLENLFAPELDGLKTVGTSGADGERYLLVANQDECDHEFSPDRLGFKEVIDVVKNSKATNCVLKPADALLLKIK